MGRPKDFKCSVESVERMRKARVAYWASEKGLAHKEKLRARLKAKWVEQKAKWKKVEVKVNGE